MDKNLIDKQIERCKYPLKKYYRNFLDRIENHSGIKKEVHQEGVKAGKVCPGIEFKIGGYVKSPKCLYGKIFMNEAFFAFLWTTIYWLFTSFEKHHVEKNNALYQGKEFKLSKEADNQIKKAFDIFEWGLSLRKEYSGWPDGLLSFNEKDPWIEKISNIWLSSASFVFYHEYAHAQGINDEEAADDFAINNACLHDNVSEERDRTCNILGGISAVIALFFLIEIAKRIS